MFRHLLAFRRLAALICVAALAMKLLVPSGYMVSGEHGRLAITLCPGVAPPATSMAMPERHHDMAGTGMAGEHAPSKDHGKTEMPCAFSSLSTQAVAAIDAVLLVLAIAFVMALGLHPARPPLRPLLRYLRPPLRGPPAPL